MQIPSHQINNVLKVYSKQVSQGKFMGRQSASGKQTPSAKVNISSEGKRESIINKVAADIVEKITSHGPQTDIERDIAKKAEQDIKDETGQDVNLTKKDNSFVFNQIDENNSKTTKTLSVDDSNFVLKRLEQLAKDAVNKTMES